MSATFLKLETIAGPGVEEAIADAVRVANLLGIWVRVEINQIDTMVAPGDNVRVLHDNWKKAAQRGAKFVSANVIPDPST